MSCRQGECLKVEHLTRKVGIGLAFPASKAEDENFAFGCLAPSRMRLLEGPSCLALIAGQLDGQVQHQGKMSRQRVSEPYESIVRHRRLDVNREGRPGLVPRRHRAKEWGRPPVDSATNTKLAICCVADRQPERSDQCRDFASRVDIASSSLLKRCLFKELFRGLQASRWR